MQEQYRPDMIEPKVQQYWAENKVFKAIKDESKEKILLSFYVPISFWSPAYGARA